MNGNDLENRRIALHNALHLADIQATHNGTPVGYENVLEAAKVFENYLEGTK